MMCFRDMTFCGAVNDMGASDCVNTECHRYFSSEDLTASRKWMGDAPIAFADMSSECDDYQHDRDWET